MALTKTYPYNPYVMDSIGFIANFLNGKRETANAQAQIDAAHNQRIGEAFGQGAGNVLGAFAQDSQANREANRRLAESLALQNNHLAGQREMQSEIAARQQQNERLRSQYDTYQLAQQDYFKKYGELPPTSPDTSSIAEPTQAPATDPALGVPQESTPPQSGVSVPLVNPALTHEFNQVKGQAQKRAMQFEMMMMDPSIPADHKQAMAAKLMPQIVRDQEVLKKYPQQDNTPTTIGPNGQPVPMRPGWNPAPDGGFSFLNADGTQQHVPPVKGKTDNIAAEWSPEQTNAYLHKQVPRYDDLISRGYDFIVQPDGKITEIKPEKSDGGEKKENKRRDEAVKQAAANRQHNAEMLAAAAAKPDDPNATRKALDSQKPEDAVQIENQLKEDEQLLWINEYSPRTITMDEYTELGRKILAEWGNDPSRVPKGLADRVRHLGYKLRGEDGEWNQSTGSSRR